jgi:hypothetical protein
VIKFCILFVGSDLPRTVVNAGILGAFFPRLEGFGVHTTERLQGHQNTFRRTR